MTTSPPALFSLVPPGLFGPLASANREHYWLLLCRLHDEFFGGPDAPVPPGHGYPRREITAAIERHLLADDPWEDDDGTPPGSPLTLRANNLYERFRQAGWLRQEKFGAREMVMMTPAVSQLLSLLVEFSERGPTFVSARIRSTKQPKAGWKCFARHYAKVNAAGGPTTATIPWFPNWTPSSFELVLASPRPAGLINNPRTSSSSTSPPRSTPPPVPRAGRACPRPWRW